MSSYPNNNQLPLSPSKLRTTKLKVARHQAEAPKFPPEPPKRKIHIIEKASAILPGPVPEALPSMPSYSGEISPTPALLPISPPTRVVFRGFELEPFTIFPPDGRSIYDDRTYPWVCVCQVASGPKSGCGVLVGPRHVLTASHVIDWVGNRDFVSFVQGGVTLDSSSSTDVYRFVEIADVDYDNADDDYAVIVLAKRLGDTFGWFGYKEYDSAWDNETSNWCNIAYAPDISTSTPVFQKGFFLDEDDFDLGGGRMLITKTGDFVRGMSGSPVFGFWDPGPYVVGVTSGGAGGLGNFNAIAGGANLNRLINIAKAELP